MAAGRVLRRPVAFCSTSFSALSPFPVTLQLLRQIRAQKAQK